MRTDPNKCKVCNTLDFGDDERDKIEVVKRKFKDYCEPRKNLPYIQHMFFPRAQKQAETIDVYIMNLKNKVTDCEFGE